MKPGRMKSGRSTSTKPHLATLPKLLGLLVPFGYQVTMIVVVMLAGSLLGLATPWLLKYSVDRLMLTGKAQLLWVPALLIVLLAMLKGVTDYYQRYRMEFVGQQVVFDLRLSAYRNLSRLSFLYFDQASTGDLMARLTSDTDVLTQFFGFISITVAGNILILLGILAVLMFWNVELGLVYVLMIPLMLHAMTIYATRVRPVFSMARRSLAALTAKLQQGLAGIRVVKLFGQEHQESQRFGAAATQYCEHNVDGARLTAKWMPYVHVLLGIATAFVIWHGGRQVVHGDISLGTLVGFTGYIAMLMRPIRQTGMMINRVNMAMVAGKRVFELTESKPDVEESSSAYPLPPIEGHVEFRDVTFSYDGKNPVLRDVNLDVAAGETIALVGPSGAGKTTLVHLLPRFYQLHHGSIQIDGHDIADVTVSSLRSQIGIIMQDVFVFDATIAENIAYGRPQDSWNRIVEVARMAQLHDFIMSLPRGYNTRVGERGARLSGGQRQRLAMARVLLTDPRLLIMDEPTAHVDAETERKLQEALAAVIRNRTVFIIAHRLWSVRFADRIVVLDEGEVVEQGTHEQLGTAGGLYQRLYELQQAGNLGGAR